MKIACVAPVHPYRGGIAHFAARLSSEISLKHELLHVNFSRLYPEFLFPGKTQFDESKHGFQFQSNRELDSINPASWYKVGKMIRKWEPDLIFFHWWHPFFAFCYRNLIRFSGKSSRIIAICHNVISHDSRGFERRLTSYGLGNFQGYVLHARSELPQLNNLKPGSQSITLFHPIYDIFPSEGLSKEEARRKLGIDVKKDVLLYFGLIRPYKGVEVLLRSISKIEKPQNIIVYIVGEIYSNRDRIMNLLSALPSESVKLVDSYIPNEEVSRWFTAADAVVLPYITATQSGVVPIAYQFNRPVIVTNTGGLSEIVREGQTGFLVTPGDPNSLAKAIDQFFVELNKPDLSEGITKIRNELSWQSYTSKLLDFASALRA